jgi:hypothetical protein
MSKIEKITHKASVVAFSKFFIFLPCTNYDYIMVEYQDKNKSRIGKDFEGIGFELRYCCLWESKKKSQKILLREQVFQMSVNSTSPQSR